MPESIDVIIACYNEAETIENVILDHLEVLENSRTFDEYLITVIDDGSKDESKSRIDKIVSNYKNVRLIQSEKPSGIHEAFNKLVNSTGNKWVYFTSGDGQYPAKILSDLILNFDSNTWVHIAKRVNKLEIYTIIRLTVSFLYRFVVLLISGVDPVDAGSTKLIRRELLEKPFYCKYLARDAEIIVRAKKSDKYVKVVNSSFGSRTAGKSTIRIGVVLKTLLDTFNLIKYRF
jgi:glycosyltransferase involved in cell wall biosynthesis